MVILVEILWGWAFQQHSGAGHSGDNLGLGTRGRLWGSKHSGDRRSRETLGLGLWVWARETLGLGTPGTGTLKKLWGRALQGDSGWETLGHFGAHSGGWAP